MKLESKIQKSIREKMESNDWVVVKLFNIPGWPDLLCLKKPGLVTFIEVKKPGEIPEKLQLFKHKILRSLGFKVYVLDSVKDITDEIIKGS